MKVSDVQIIEAAQSSLTMADGARKVGLHLSSFVNRTKRLGVHKPNPQRKGIARSASESANTRIPLEEILAGKHPQYGTSPLKRRLLAEKILEDVCVLCGDTSQSYSRILDHINGIHNDHVLRNLRLVCPKCNAALPTHAGRNKKKITKLMSDDVMLELIMVGSSNREILRQLEMTPNGANYRRVDRLRLIVETILRIAQLGESVDPEGSNPSA